MNDAHDNTNGNATETARSTFDIPDGRYTTRAKFWFWDQSKNGNTMLLVEFPIAFPGEGGQPAEASLHARLTFTDNTWERSMESLRAMGFVGDDMSAIGSDPDSGEAWGELNASEVSVVVEHEEYEGQSRPRIRWINPLQKRWTPKSAPDANTMSAFAAQMKARLAATGQSAASPAPAAPPPPQGRMVAPQAAAAQQPRPQAPAPAARPGGPAKLPPPAF